MSTDPTQTNTTQPEFTGLTASEVEESRRRHGANVLTPPPRDPWWRLYLEKFEDPIIRILLVAAVIAILAGIIEHQYAEGIGIIIAVFLATTLGFINEYKAGQEFDILNKVSDDDPIKVIRDGAYSSVPKRDLVVGDVLSLEQGEEIPADGEVLSAVSFQVNEASLTGESLPVTKRPKSAPGGGEGEVALAYPRHQVLRGTFVSDGHALVRVSSVGDSSEIGKTARSAAEETETVTPLNRQLAKLGQLIGVFGFAIAFLIFASLTVKSGVQGTLGNQVPVTNQSLADGAVAEGAGGAPGGPQGAIGEADLKAAADKAREALVPTLGEKAKDLPLRQRFQDGELVHYLALPLTGAQAYFLAIAFVSLFLALNRIWLPVCFDAVELSGRKRPSSAWLDREGLAPWLQSLGAGALLFLLGLLAGWCLGILTGGLSSWLPVATSMTLLRFFMVAVTIIVVAVPEGLPMSVTLSLAYSMRKMTAANNLVRRMHACETIGAATVICSDKTGTLTMNKMKVASVSFANLPAGAGKAHGPEWDLVVEAVAANSTADLGADSEGRLTKPLGNPTESALLLWLEENGEGYKAKRAAFRVLGQLTFSTERKYMATVGMGILPDGPTLHAKGAPEIILGKSGSRRLPDGSVQGLTEDDRAGLHEALKAEQSRGMRTLGLAYTREGLPERELQGEEIQASVESGSLVFLGFFSIADPVRPEVPPAVEACSVAGVKVKMVTGDNQATAREIALDIGIIKAEDEGGEGSGRLIVPGDEFMAMDDPTAEKASEELRIMSRAKPLAKQRLVQLLQKNGEVVAVTGDGSNDAPALNHADVGLAMGMTGTSVAKEAADIILLDDSFASIVKAIMWGRSIYANIQKFILFQLTINVLALGVALLGPFLGIQLPLTVTQMLWVNLIMDTFAALALASEPPDWGLMRKPPRDPEAFIVTPGMARFIFSVGGFFLLLFLILVIGLRGVFPLDPDTPQGLHNLSVFFTSFVFVQFWNLFNARMLGSDRSALSGLKESRMFLLIVIVIGIGQVCMTQFGGTVFRTVPLGAREWVLIIVCTSPVLWVGELFRLARRRAGAKGPGPLAGSKDPAALPSEGSPA
ncbi:MAG: calcium-translocating P-type ATPase, PMCA-type [Deltaproteobacteria bacterium]|jgi:Ca2+-transporting ATPase|nr:calcium-translocating P-type ATPase, PMCA-type [Deltaproteobacteria bacterium]